MCNSASLSIRLLSVASVFKPAVNDNGTAVTVASLMEVQQMLTVSMFHVARKGACRFIDVGFVSGIG